MSELSILVKKLQQHFPEASVALAYHEATLTLTPAVLTSVATTLQNHIDFCFEQLQDVCGVDYLDYGLSEWNAEKATGQGFERAALRNKKINVLERQGPRFAVAYHLLSLQHNWRLRLLVLLDESLIVPSVVDIWPSANWFEREAFDLFGILFEGHPDLRRILTDYGFIGHPFRKDFPLSGHVEVRYDATSAQVVYEPVDIVPRVLVPKIIRQDQRYASEDHAKGAQ